MKLAVNYSHPLSALVRAQRVGLDRFKCPAWLDLVAEAQSQRPAYVHFPLKVGLGIGDALDTETKQRADWDKVELLLAQTGTSYVNLHMVPRPQDYPSMPPDTTDSAHQQLLIENTLRDVRAVIARFGAERVIVENDHADKGTGLLPTILPDTIGAVVAEAGCGFLLDISHARLAAARLGVDARQYITALPVQRIREVHVTGIQWFDERLVESARRAGVAENLVQRFAGRWMDHLPMTADDWDFLAWALAQIRDGVWGCPWVVAFEVGGVGGIWEIMADSQTLAAQVPRLYEMVHANNASPSI